MIPRPRSEVAHGDCGVTVRLIRTPPDRAAFFHAALQPLRLRAPAYRPLRGRQSDHPAQRPHRDAAKKRSSPAVFFAAACAPGSGNGGTRRFPTGRWRAQTVWLTMGWSLVFLLAGAALAAQVLSRITVGLARRRAFEAAVNPEILGRILSNAAFKEGIVARKI